MAKHNGVTIRMGAAYDDVTVRMSDGKSMHFDRAAMSKRKHEGDHEAKEQLYTLRKGIVDAFVVQKELKDARKAKRKVRNQRRVQKEQYIAA